MIGQLKLLRAFGLAAALWALAAGSALAALEWTNPSLGNWAVGSNWMFGGIPFDQTDASINNGGLALVTSAGAASKSLVLGSASLFAQSGFLDVQGAGRLTIGSGGLSVKNGTMSVTSGGRAVAGSTTLGVSPIYVGTMLVTGANSYLSSGSLDLITGGSLRIESGGRVDSTTAGGFPAALTGGSATVTGTNSLWFVNGIMYAGGGTSGEQVTVSNRGTVVNAGGATITNNSTVNVTGAGSSFNNSGGTTTYIGSAGTGSLIVQNGGLMTSANADVGHGTFGLGAQFPGTGHATVTGAGSTWNNSADLAIGASTSGGASGTGDLNVASGGRVTSATARLGAQANSSGTAYVSGAGSTLANSGDIAVGDAGVGDLEISGGGKVTTFRTFVAYSSGASGSVIVRDPGSTLTGGGSFFIGNGGGGSLHVLNGGVASTAGNSYLGFETTALGRALVSGAGSTWNTAVGLYIGGSGATPGGAFGSTLRVENGGVVNAGAITLYNTGTLELANDTTMTGPLTSLGGLIRTSGNTALANDITLGAGGVNIANQTAGAVSTVSGAISGSGGLTYSAQDAAATLRLTGSSSYTGATTVNSGRLVVDGSIASATTINGGATLAGAGSVGPITINSGGTVSPGNSPGLLTTGDAMLGGGGAYQLQLRSDGTGTAGVDWDSLAVNGLLDISTLSSGSPFALTLHTLDGGDNASPLDAWDPSASHTWLSIVSTTGGLIGDFDPSLFQVDATDFQSAVSGAFSVAWDGASLNLQYDAPIVTPPPADFDGDGQVDAGDLGIWQNNFPLDEGAGPADGDANGDGAVDGADFLVWQQQLDGNLPAIAANGPIPEPATSLLFIVAAAWIHHAGGRMRQELMNA